MVFRSFIRAFSGRVRVKQWIVAFVAEPALERSEGLLNDIPPPVQLLLRSQIPMANIWQLQRGATVVNGGVRFSVWAPLAKRVRVRLTSEGEGEYELTRGD